MQHSFKEKLKTRLFTNTHMDQGEYDSSIKLIKYWTVAGYVSNSGFALGVLFFFCFL